MGIKAKMRMLCGLTAFFVLVSTCTCVTVVKADEEISEGQMQVYRNQIAVQQYIIEHGMNNEEDKESKDYRDGFVHVQNVELNIGDTYSVVGTDAHYGSSDPNVASVDGNGVITAKNDGSASVITYLKDGSLYNKVYITVRKPGGNNNNNNNNNKNNNVVYYPVYNPYYAPYYVPPVYAITPTVNPTWNAVANNMIAATPKRGTVNLSSGGPLFFDVSFANMLKLRPDVTVNVTYGYNGHIFLLTIPRGYNLTSKLNPAGYVDFVTLSNVIDGKIRCSLVY